MRGIRTPLYLDIFHHHPGHSQAPISLALLHGSLDLPILVFPWQFFAGCSSLFSGTLGKTRQKIAVQFLQCLNPVPVARCSSWYWLFISMENCVVYRFNPENQFKSFKKPLILLCSPALNTVMNNCNKCDYYYFLINAIPTEHPKKL